MSRGVKYANAQQIPHRKIRSIPFDEMSYTDMLIEIRIVHEKLQDRWTTPQERIDLHKYLKKLNREVYDYEKFRGIPHTAI